MLAQHGIITPSGLQLPSRRAACLLIAKEQLSLGERAAILVQHPKHAGLAAARALGLRLLVGLRIGLALPEEGEEQHGK